MTDVVMPQMGESITEGTVTRWLKRVGEHVERDQPLLEISTDKVDAEIPAPATGVLGEILVVEGITVAVGTVLARISTPQQASPQPGQQEPAGAEAERAAPESSAEPAPVASQGPAPEQTVTAPSQTDAAPATQLEEVRRTRSSPVVRRMAADHKVDLGVVRGTGIDGRVTRQDLENYLAQGGAVVSPPASLPAPTPTPRPAAPPPAVPRPVEPAIPATRPTEDGEQAVPLSPQRRRTAEQMSAARRIAAHATTVFEVDMTHVERLREARARGYQGRGAAFLSCLPYVLKAAADALRSNPLLNASLDEGRIIYHKHVHIGVAIALERGMLAPVIRHADSKSVSDLARELADVTDRARTRRLKLDEVQRATFTVTDSGAAGGLLSVPIIQQPQVAILSVGAIEKRPVVVADAIAIRSAAFLTLSFDQRLVDVADADRFLAQIKRRLAEFEDSGL